MLSLHIENTPRLTPRIYGNAIIEYLNLKSHSKKYSIRSLDWKQKSVRVVGEAFIVGIFHKGLFFDKKIGTLKYEDNSIKREIIVELGDNLMNENELEKIVNNIRGKEIGKK